MGWAMPVAGYACGHDRGPCVRVVGKLEQILRQDSMSDTKHFEKDLKNSPKSRSRHISQLLPNSSERVGLPKTPIEVTF